MNCPLAFYPYIRSCVRCGRVPQLPTVAHKPSSDSIGRYTSLCMASILNGICRHARNGWRARLVASSSGEVDLVLYSSNRIVLCEIKASPLVAFRLGRLYDEPLEEEVNGTKVRIQRHMTNDVPDSNLHPVIHYEEYLQGFEDAVWTYESNLQDDAASAGWKRVHSNSLSPFYDMLFTLTRSWFRDKHLEHAFDLTRIYRAFGGQV